MAEEVKIAKEATLNTNTITSNLVVDVINGGNSNTINEPMVEDSNSKKEEGVEVNNQVEDSVIDTQQPTYITELEDELLKQANKPEGSINTPVEFQQSIEAIRKQYEDLAKKQKSEYQEELAKMQLKIEQQKQKELMAGMSETEKERYALNLKVKELQETINVYETRNKELEDKLEKQNNEKYISDRIQETPYIKDFITKLNVKTRAEYESKIVPILGQMKELQDLKSQNQMFGNKNAFAGYGANTLKENSNVHKQIEAYSNDFLKGLIKK